MLWKREDYAGRTILEWYLDRAKNPRRPRRIYVVECECGTVRHIWAMAWAGNGFYRCSGCGRKVPKRRDLLYPPLEETFCHSITVEAGKSKEEARP